MNVKKTLIPLDKKNESAYWCHCMSKIVKESQKKSKRIAKRFARRAKREAMHQGDKKDVR
jgi:hypothetical protein